MTATANFKILGKKVGKDMKAVAEAIKGLDSAALTAFEKTGTLQVCGHTLTAEDIQVSREVAGASDPNIDTSILEEGPALTLDFTYDEDLALMKSARDVSNLVQKLRKDAGLQQDDVVDMWAEAPGKGNKLQGVLAKKAEYIDQLLRRPLWSGARSRQGHEVIIK